MLYSSPIFKRNGAYLVEKNMFEKKTRTVHSWGFSALNMQKHFWFVSNFEDVKFAINGKHSKNIMIIQSIMLPLWSFKDTKM